MSDQIIEVPTQSQTVIDISTIDGWSAQGQALFNQHRETLWSIAAWMEAGAREFGDAAQTIALGIFGKSQGEMRKIMDTAKRFPPAKRRPELSLNHHALVVNIEAEKADEILDKAVAEKLSVSALKKVVAVVRESEGGDIFQQMAAVPMEALVDDWTGKIIRLFNCAPSQEARDAFVEILSENESGLIMQ